MRRLFFYVRWLSKSTKKSATLFTLFSTTCTPPPQPYDKELCNRFARCVYGTGARLTFRVVPSPETHPRHVAGAISECANRGKMALQADFTGSGRRARPTRGNECGEGAGAPARGSVKENRAPHHIGSGQGAHRPLYRVHSVPCHRSSHSPAIQHHLLSGAENLKAPPNPPHMLCTLLTERGPTRGNQ